jgi:hypothetical protein
VFATLEPELQMAGYFGAGSAPPALDAAGIPPSAQRCGATLVSRLDLPVQIIRVAQLPCELHGAGTHGSGQLLVVRRLAARRAAVAEPGRAQWLGGATLREGRLFWHGDAPWNASVAATGAELRDLLLRVYYVARSADGVPGLPALRVKSLTSIAGTPAFIDTEVMHGIADMQIELLPTPAAPRVVQLRLRVRADTLQRRGRAPATLQVTRHFALRNLHG